MSDSRTLSARKTLYLDAPKVSLQPSSTQNLQVGGLTLNNFTFESAVTYGGLFPDTIPTQTFRIARVGDIAFISLPPFDAPITVTVAGNTMSVIPNPLPPSWLNPAHSAIYSFKLLVNGSLVNAYVSITGGFTFDTPLIIGDEVDFAGAFYNIQCQPL